ALSKSAVLIRCNGRRPRIGPELRGNVAHHAANRAQKVGREDVLVGDLCGAFRAGPILTLAGRFLDQSVWDQEPRCPVSQRYAQSIGIAEVSLQSARERCARTVI